MIAIVNVSLPKGDPPDLSTYQVRINHSVIAGFQHRRSDGLAKCLMRAAEAVLAAEALAIESAFPRTKEGGGNGQAVQA